MTSLRWLCCALVVTCAGCLSVRAQPKKTYPNIVVPEGPGGSLSGVTFEGVAFQGATRDLCAKDGLAVVCIGDFGGAMESGITRLFGEYFHGDGPVYEAKFTINEFKIGRRNNECGEHTCSSDVPVLEWRFDLVRKDDGSKPVRVALTTYAHQAFHRTAIGGKTDESAEALLHQVLKAINARLSPAKR